MRHTTDPTEPTEIDPITFDPAPGVDGRPSERNHARRRPSRRPRTHRVRRRRWALILVVGAAIMPGPVAGAGPCWRQPVVGEVVDAFRAPRCPWCPGNRGIEYRSEPGAVRAVAAGTVTFSGSVAGTRYVVVQLAGGWKLTYGRLAATSVRAGTRVAAGSVVGAVSDEFFFGLRVGDRYVDPGPYLGRLVGRPRLIPIDGAAARRPPPPRLTCAR